MNAAGTSFRWPGPSSEGSEDGSQLKLSPSAERALVSRTYRNRNVAELRSVIELAGRVADGPVIRAEHVFSGFAEEKPIGLDISELLAGEVVGCRRRGSCRSTCCGGFFLHCRRSLPGGRVIHGRSSGQRLGVGCLGTGGLRAVSPRRFVVVHGVSTVLYRENGPAFPWHGPAPPGVDHPSRRLAVGGRAGAHSVV